MKNRVDFVVYGRYALFTDPLTKTGGEKYSYQVPTYEALKGILSSVYWKPTIVWIIDAVRVLKPIRTQTKGAKPLKYGGGNDLSIYTYLSDVAYQVQAHFEWNLNRPDMAQDRNENKHYFVSKRMIERGGRRDVFLGTRECQAYVEPCRFGDGAGFYDGYGELSFGLMFHGFDYPDESGTEDFFARFWWPTMSDGVIRFMRPEECSIRKRVRPMKPNPPESVGLAEQRLLDDYTDFGGSKTSHYELYREALSEWCNSEYSHPKITAVLRYIERGKVIGDLVDWGTLLTNDNGELLKKTDFQGTGESESIFDVLGAQEQEGAFVRWIVEVPGDMEPRVWKDRSLWDSWIVYYTNTKERQTLCYVSGEVRFAPDQHPSKIRNDGDKGKLISANDSSGFTYRGRFTDSEQAAGIGFTVTQKAHNALRWVISRQGERQALEWRIPVGIFLPA